MTSTTVAVRRLWTVLLLILVLWIILLQILPLLLLVRLLPVLMMYNIVLRTDVIHDEERCLTMAPASNDHPSSYLPQMTQTRRAQHAVLWLFVAQERWNGFVFRYVKRRGEVENSAVQQRCDKRAIPVPADSQEKLNGSREEEEHRVKRRDKYESVKRWSLCMLYICDLEVKCSCSVCDT